MASDKGITLLIQQEVDRHALTFHELTAQGPSHYGVSRINYLTYQLIFTCKQADPSLSWMTTSSQRFDYFLNIDLKTFHCFFFRLKS